MLFICTRWFEPAQISSTFFILYSASNYLPRHFKRKTMQQTKIQKNMTEGLNTKPSHVTSNGFEEYGSM